MEEQSRSCHLYAMHLKLTNSHDCLRNESGLVNPYTNQNLGLFVLKAMQHKLYPGICLTPEENHEKPQSY
jgi:hypothetical protein